MTQIDILAFVFRVPLFWLIQTRGIAVHIFVDFFSLATVAVLLFVRKTVGGITRYTR
jgi:hypothetical protein